MVVDVKKSEKNLVKKKEQRKKRNTGRTHTSWAMPIREDREDREVYIYSQ